VDDPRDFACSPASRGVDTAIATVALAGSVLGRKAGAPPPCKVRWRGRPAWLEQRECGFAETGRCAIPGRSPAAGRLNTGTTIPGHDDTMMVLMSLEAAHAAGVASSEAHRAISRRCGGCFLQCRDGGWAAFDRDVTQRCWKRCFADHQAILDPSCADLTGRVLSCWAASSIVRRGAGCGGR